MPFKRLLVPGLLVAVGVPFAATPRASAATITACVANQNGTVRFVASPSNCIPGLESSVQFNTSGSSGSTGATGPAGATGPQGATGSIGPMGVTGTAGLPGATGATGFAGATGATGLAGVTGAAGATGSMGLPGTTGATGSMGLPGTTGATGSMGLPGTTGATGSMGLPGTTGATGSMGLPGTTGATGSMGLPGTTGATGANGATGPAGVTGPAGKDGATGSQGLVGPTGPAGVTSVNNSGIPFVGTGHTTNTAGQTLYFYNPGSNGTPNPLFTDAQGVITDTACTAQLKIYSFTGQSTTYTLYAGNPTVGSSAVNSPIALATYTTSSSTPFTLTGNVASGQAVSVGVTVNGNTTGNDGFYTKLVCQ